MAASIPRVSPLYYRVINFIDDKDN